MRRTLNGEKVAERERMRVKNKELSENVFVKKARIIRSGN